MIGNRPEQSKEEVKSSVTAITVASGFARAILMGYDYIFDIREAHLVQHLTNIGMHSLRGKIWLLGTAVSTLPYSWQQSFFNYAGAVGYDHIVLLRKLMIMQKIEQAIQNGVKQIVVLGGGYDIRALMTALKHPEVNVYEIDRGPTRTCKLLGLSCIPEELEYQFELTNVNPDLKKVNDNMHYINADLSIEGELARVLSTVNFDREADSLFIAEGVSMYIDQAANRDLLDSVRNLMTEASEFLISYSTSTMYTQLSEIVQTSSNELYKFLLPKENVIEFAASSSMAVVQQFSAAHALADINDPNADYYKVNGKKRLEIYYTMKKQAMVPINDINDVPVIKLDLPEKPENDIESWSCNIL